MKDALTSRDNVLTQSLRRGVSPYVYHTVRMCYVKQLHSDNAVSIKSLQEKIQALARLLSNVTKCLWSYEEMTFLHHCASHAESLYDGMKEVFKQDF